MPRQPRYPLPSISQHVIQRGNNHQPVFFADDDYRFYLACLQHAAARLCGMRLCADDQPGPCRG
jgi:putative transposase